ncbi:TPM domain-containing protein [Streptomyces sp. NPDC060030]|uniref:TPM domain-containing protein n=1 Tax=Streptomyces sp. NPDC060030 TaxID=3347042 RepID=UPI0036C99881
MTPPASHPGVSRLSIPGRILAATLTAALWMSLPGTPAARATEPVPSSREGQITDEVGALGDRKPQAETALDRLFETRRVKLSVACVPDFSGRDAQTWTAETANRDGLGQDDVLLAVATHDRRYAYSVDQGSRLTDDRLRDVANTAVEPALRQNDWAAAAVGAADGYAAVLSGDPVTAPAVTPGAAEPGDGSAGTGVSANLLVPLAVLVVALATAVLTFSRRRRRTRTRTTPAAGRRRRRPSRRSPRRRWWWTS